MTIDLDQLNAKLYHALIKKEKDEVLSLCEQLPPAEGPMRVVTIHNDSVLHVALYSMQVDLVDKLLDRLSNDPKPIMHANTLGNTVLHEAATYDKFQSVAKRMLQLQFKLLTAKNKNEETPLFRAARYGKMKMFKFLDEEQNQTFGEEKAKEFHKTCNGSTILHAAVEAEHFELAIWIANKYEYLYNKTDADNLTALQLLANNPFAFQFRGQGWLKKFMDSCIKNNSEDEDSRKVTSRYRVPWWDQMLRKRKRYNAAVELANLLIKSDISWKATEYVGSTSDAQKSVEAEKKKVEKQKTPMLLATQTGCFEIAREILNKHPQGVEQIDRDGRCILHIAIEYRQMVIFDMVEKMEVPMRRLIRKCDARGNSILHMVGKKIINEDVEQNAKRSPSFQLQEDLLLFERIKKVVKPHFHKLTNLDDETAEELFIRNKEALRDKSQEWLKRTAENCSIIAVLIATVAFAAAYTVPGGSNPDGSPVLLNQTFFVIFTIGDVLSLTFCLTAVVIFLSILTSSFQLREFKSALPQKLMLGITCLLLSVTMMMLAFAATVILMIRNNERWTRIALYTVAFLPVTVFAGFYMPLYVSHGNFQAHSHKNRVLFPSAQL